MKRKSRIWGPAEWTHNNCVLKYGPCAFCSTGDPAMHPFWCPHNGYIIKRQRAAALAQTGAQCATGAPDTTDNAGH